MHARVHVQVAGAHRFSITRCGWPSLADALRRAMCSWSAISSASPQLSAALMCAQCARGASVRSPIGADSSAACVPESVNAKARAVTITSKRCVIKAR